MTEARSAYLDLVRFLAALAVVVSHFAYPRFTGGSLGWARDFNIGSDAVVVFFVLSGFIITFAARKRRAGLGEFAFARLSRLWSVAVPALLLTLLCDTLGQRIAPEFYSGVSYYAAVPQWEFWLRGLTFSNYWAGSQLRLGTNGPYWSLGYEVAYYALFAVAVYLRGTRRAMWLAVLCFLFGLPVLLLMPAWLMGAAAFGWVSREGRAEMPKPAAWALCVGPVLLYVAMQGLDVPEQLMDATVAAVGQSGVVALGFSNEFIWNALIGALFSAHIVGAWSLLETRATFRWGHAVKWLAGGSFSLYLVHNPMLHLGHVALPRTGSEVLDGVLLLCAVVAACYVFAEAFERTLGQQRRVAKTIWARMRGSARVGVPLSGS